MASPTLEAQEIMIGLLENIKNRLGDVKDKLDIVHADNLNTATLLEENTATTATTAAEVAALLAENTTTTAATLEASTTAVATLLAENTATSAALMAQHIETEFQAGEVARAKLDSIQETLDTSFTVLWKGSGQV